MRRQVVTSNNCVNHYPQTTQTTTTTTTTTTTHLPTSQMRPQTLPFAPQAGNVVPGTRGVTKPSKVVRAPNTTSTEARVNHAYQAVELSGHPARDARGGLPPATALNARGARDGRLY
ncbi:MAG: hypothetical protein CK425_00445 [Parachlamydia sp.]|nr:MAG: hypothetical protein CK425_00445 [Parachlamydia sp.]